MWRAFTCPSRGFASIDSFVSILAVAPLIALWRKQAECGGEPNEIVKIATGAFIAAAANLFLVAGEVRLKPVPILVPLTYDILLGVAFLYYWPTLLALVSRAAPPGLKSTLMGCAFLSLFVSNVTLGRIGSFYEQMTPAQFWALHAGIAATGGILALIFNRPLMGALNAPETAPTLTRNQVADEKPLQALLFLFHSKQLLNVLFAPANSPAALR